MRVTSLGILLYAARMQLTSLAIIPYATRVRLTLLPLNEPQFFVPMWITLVAREALQFHFEDRLFPRIRRGSDYV